jgi:hypothetical protein
LIRAARSGSKVPREIASKEEFEKLAEGATEVRVVRKGENAKVKLRTPEALYTFKTTTEEADGLIKGVKLPVVEI